MSAVSSGGECGGTVCVPLWDQVISKSPVASDGHTTPHIHGQWDSGTCLVLGEGNGDPYLDSSLGQ